MAKQISVSSQSGNITVTTSRSVIGTVANVESANTANFANQANTANVAFSVDGANVSGVVANATFAISAESANTANVAGIANALDADIANVSISGGTNGYVLQTDGAGNLTWTQQTGGGGGNAAAAGANTEVQFNDEGVFGASANFKFNKSTNILTASNFEGDGSRLSNITAANISGEVANAAFATSAGSAEQANIANIAYSVDGANVSGEVAVANTVSNPTQSNITSVGTLTGLTVNGNITANVITANTLVGNLALTEIDYIDFDLLATVTGQQGRLWWNAGDGTLDLGMNANVTQQIGQETYFYARALENVTNGQVVMFAGSQGDKIEFRAANTASVGFQPRYVIGVATENIASGELGYITSFGMISELATNAFPEGSILYLQPNTAGVLTTVEPSPPEPKIVVAACVTQASAPGATNGRIFVRPDFGYYMNQLHDVANGNTASGDVLVYDGNVWQTSNSVPFANAAAQANIANIANVAYSVDGANVNGEVANAAFATSAGSANTANTASEIRNSNSSVTFTGVDGDVNVTIDGNIVANINQAGADITGELIADKLSVTDGNVSNYNTVIAPETIATPGPLSSNVIAQLSANSSVVNTFGTNRVTTDVTRTTGITELKYRQDPATGNTAYMGREEWLPVGPIGNSAADPLQRSYYSIEVVGPQTDRSNVDYAGWLPTALTTRLDVGLSGGIGLTTNAPLQVGGFPSTLASEIGIFGYINETTNSVAMLTQNTRRGTNINRATVQANDRLGDIVWKPGVVNFSGTQVIQGNGAGFGGIVDSSYTGNNSERAGVGIQFTVLEGNIDDSSPIVEYNHDFYANGEVSFASDVAVTGNISATNLGNIASINLTGSNTDVLYGNGVFAPVSGGGATDEISNGNSSVTFTGVDGDVNITIDGSVIANINASGADIVGDLSSDKLVVNDGNADNYSATFAPGTVSTPGSIPSALETTYSNNSSVIHSFATNKVTSHLSTGGVENFYFKEEGGNVGYMGRMSFAPLGPLGNTQTDPLQRGTFQVDVIGPQTDKSTVDGDLTNFQIGFVTGGLNLNTNAPLIFGGFPAAQNPQFQSTGYINETSNSVALLRQDSRRGTNGSRAPVQGNDRLGDIVWRPGVVSGTGTQIFQGTGARVGAVVDGNYTGGTGETAGVGIDIQVLDENAVSTTHEFYSNGEVQFNGPISATNLGNIASINLTGNSSQVLLGDGNFGTAPTPIAIENGDSKIDFTGPGGEARFNIDGSTKTYINGSGILLEGANTGPGDISRLDIQNGALNWTLDNTNFSGGTPFGMSWYANSGGFIEPMNFVRARGNVDTPLDVQSGDTLFNQRVQARYDGVGNKGAMSQFVNVRSFSPDDEVAVDYVLNADGDAANSRFQVQFQSTELKDVVIANGIMKLSDFSAADLANITGSVGQTVAVNDDGGKLAYWDTTNSRWSYVFDNSAV